MSETVTDSTKDGSETISEQESLPAPSQGDIGTKPAAGQIITHQGKTFTTVNEGLAYILIPPDAPLLTDPKAQLEDAPPSQSVFYNPIQQYNRDLTILAIRAFGEDFVDIKRTRLGKQWKQRQQKMERKKKKQDSAVGADSVSRSNEMPASKRRRVDDAMSEHVPAASKVETDVTRTAPKTLDALDEDELMDEDFLACESSAIQSVAAVPAETSEQGGEKKELLGTNKKESEPTITFTILDALSATGLRALRYAKELEFTTSITANDLSAKAVQSIELNIKHNGLEGKIKTATGNANAHMYQFVGQEGRGGLGHQYDVIDIDPYGTAVPFLDAAVQAVTDGGLLCVTCTDTAVFNSMGYLEKTFSLYGGLPVKGEHCHEVGLRLILHAITTTAAKYGISIEPLLSLSIDYYARVFVRIRKSPLEVKFLGSKTAIVYGCDHGCGAWTQQPIVRATEQEGRKSKFYKYSAAQGPPISPLCEHCGSKMHISGPMYSGPLHNPAFIERMLALMPDLDPKVYKTLDRMEGMLETAQEEMELFEKDALFAKSAAKSEMSDEHSYARLSETAVDHHPFYVVTSTLARIIHCQAPSIAQLRGALRHAGYKAVRSHAKPGSIKTDAPWSAIWHIMREWVRQKAPLREGALKQGMPGFQIMQQSTAEIGVKPNRSAPVPNDANGEESGAKEDGEISTKSAESVKPEIKFDEQLGRDKEKKRLVRYQMNPRANWGPMTRAK
ncbi:TRM-domain-containing protein [Tothia fuscella]|uniref:tRNA (guanine(26)-N(2))-dimethyltransferase n=1 Tax=Tothia fuscella TaxID=1048955 RepID=A0A9P4NKK7_9PEZI|nr:TRM-domain-containing protein [Tothia fuscella]